MAATDAASPPQLGSVVHGYRVEVPGVEAVDADAVAAMFNARAVHVAALSEVDADVGAALRGAEENQIASAQSRYIVRLNRQRLAELFLLIGISG